MCNPVILNFVAGNLVIIVLTFQVFDIVIHRYLELPPVAKSLETLLDHLGGLYKFHGKFN